MLYNIGDKVRWKSGAVGKTQQDTIGVVAVVIPSDTHIDDFAVYAVKFDFGWISLYGRQLERSEPKAA